MSQYLGDISAYALAVSQGYTGTEEEYAELMASYATVGQTAVTAAQTATTKASEAATSATTATNKAREATTAATTATTKAGEASTSASTATSAKDTAVSAASTATTKATEATTAAATATSAATTATTAKDDAVSAKTAAQTAQTGAETAAASVQSSAEQIATNAADISQLKSDIGDLPYSLYHVAHNIDGKYLNANGEEQNCNGWSITEYFRINGTATYYIKTAVISNNVRSCFYDSEKEFISAFQTDTAGENTLVAPNNAKYVRFSVQTSDANDFSYSSLLFMPYEENVIVPELVYGSSLAETFLDTLTTGSYYDTTGGISASASWSRTKLYPVEEGDAIYIENAFGLCAVYYDSNKSFVSYKDIGVSTKNVTFNVPTGVSYIGFNIVNANLSGYNCTVNGKILGEKYSIEWLKESTNNNSIWKNKIYISHGDSTTWQDKRAYIQGEHIGEIARGYQTIFSETVGLGSYNNFGRSGWSMGVVNDNGIVNTIKGVADYGIYNLCTIACGTNDFKLNVPLGTLGVIGDTTFDDSTFYGAFRDSIEYILTSSPTIRIVLMTPLQRDNGGYDVNYTNSAGHKLIDYVNAIKAIGEMYGLPVCDMYGNSGFTKKTLSTYTMDGLHPNDVGYKRMGDYLTGFLNTVGN